MVWDFLWCRHLLRYAVGEFDWLSAAEIAAWMSTGTRPQTQPEDVLALPTDTLVAWAERRKTRLQEARLCEYREDGPSDAVLDELGAVMDEFTKALSAAGRRGDYGPLRVVYAAEHGLRDEALEAVAQDVQGQKP